MYLCRSVNMIYYEHYMNVLVCELRKQCKKHFFVGEGSKEVASPLEISQKNMPYLIIDEQSSVSIQLC